LPVAPARRKAQAPGEQCALAVQNCTQSVTKLSPAHHAIGDKIQDDIHG
jgi:hypothetical protein